VRQSDPAVRATPIAEQALRRARVSVVFAFATHAAVTGTLAPRIPSLKEQAGVGPGGLGAALAGFAGGLLVGTRLAGWPIRRFGSRAVIRLGTLLMCASLAGVGLAHNLASLAAALFVLGAFGGLLDVAFNTHAVVVERGYRRPLMSGIHSAWSAGLLFGATAGTVAAALDVSPLLHFALAAAVLGAVSLWALRNLLPRAAETPEALEPDDQLSPIEARRIGTVLLIGAVAFGSFLGEGAAADWSAVYVRGLGANAGLGGLAVVLFSLDMMACRFVADRLAARFGAVAVVRAGGLLAASALAFGLALGTTWAALVSFALLGLGLGPVVPTAFSAAGNTPTGGGRNALGWVVTLGYLGSILGPALIGWTAEWSGLRSALGIPAVLALLIALLARRVGAAPGEMR
jgi:MFS family permease